MDFRRRDDNNDDEQYHMKSRLVSTPRGPHFLPSRRYHLSLINSGSSERIYFSKRVEWSVPWGDFLVASPCGDSFGPAVSPRSALGKEVGWTSLLRN